MLAQVVHMPSNCDELIDLTVELEHRLLERKGDKLRGDARPLLFRPKVIPEDHSPTPDGSEPMQIGGIKGPISQAERDKRRKLKLCLYCGKPDHFIMECKSRPKAARKWTPGATTQSVVNHSAEELGN